MRTIKVNIDYQSADDEFTLYFLTDTHLGARSVDEKLLERHVAQIAANPRALWIGGGDYIDCIARKGDKRYDEENMAVWTHGKGDVMKAEKERFLEIVRPIARQCIELRRGNHEGNALKYYDRDIYSDIVAGVAQMAGREPHELNGGIEGFTVLRFQWRGSESTGHRWPMVIYSHHGAGGGSLPGGHALTLGRVLNAVEADLVFMGHRHIRQYVDQVVSGPSSLGEPPPTPAGDPYGARRIRVGRPAYTTRVGLFVASYMGTHVEFDRQGNEIRPVNTYAQDKGMRPVPLGTTPVIIRPKAREFTVMLSREGISAGVQV